MLNLRPYWASVQTGDKITFFCESGQRRQWEFHFEIFPVSPQKQSRLSDLRSTGFHCVGAVRGGGGQDPAPSEPEAPGLGGVDGEDVGQALEFGLFALLENEGACEGKPNKADGEDGEDRVDEDARAVVAGVGPGATGAAGEFAGQSGPAAAGAGTAAAAVAA